jgi:two-component system cell cycle response regulator
MAKSIATGEPFDMVFPLKGDAILITKVLTQATPATHHIQHVSNLATALKTLAENEFDVVLLDRSLPDTTGFNGLLSIQNMAPKLPIIFLTGHKDEAIALSAVEHGAQDYLLKDKTDSHTIQRAIQYAIRRKRFEGELILKANFVPLTGLVNRILFENRLDQALVKMKRHDEGIAVYFIDLDGFKQINDTLGHATGDKLLQQVAERLKKSLRPYDTAARFGGDEFALLVDGIKTSHDCAAIAQNIIKQLDTPFNISGKQIDINVSIGIATCMNKESASRDELMKQADEAMYAAKVSARSEYQFYNAAK